MSFLENQQRIRLFSEDANLDGLQNARGRGGGGRHPMTVVSGGGRQNSVQTRFLFLRVRESDDDLRRYSNVL